MWGREKVAFWRTKAAISLKRVKIDEKLLWTAYINSPTLFRTVPSPTPYGLPFLEIGGLQPSHPFISKKQVKLRTSNFEGTFIDRSEQKPMKMLGAVGVVRESRKFSGHPCMGRIARSSLR